MHSVPSDSTIASDMLVPKENILHVLKQGKFISYMLFSDGRTKKSHKECIITIQVILHLLKKLLRKYKHIHENVCVRNMAPCRSSQRTNQMDS